MGANVSSQKTKSVSKTINRILNSVTTEISTESHNESNASQEMSVDIKGKCKNIVLTQIMANKLSVLTKMSDSQMNDLATQVKNAVKKDIQQATYKLYKELSNHS